ncbi:MAG: helix-turn-helix domain-containing protein [Chloroflexi bacterium]|nr:helix-turn-helix domain-containing protein [Chloroflexota bacterium]
MSETRWLSTDEIADYLGVKRDTIYKWIERHNFPAHKAGRLWKFRKDEVDTWLVAGNHQQPAPEEQKTKEAA